MSEPRHQQMHASSSKAITRNVRVEVESRFAPEHSEQMQGLWFFRYTVRITNLGSDTVQLVSRHWTITDGAGRVREVKGPGVVGEQPILGPGESFRYTSGCDLNTSTGTMEGTYQMVDEDGQTFDVEIAPFALHPPYTVH